jgi:hypothetical protein
MTVFHFTDTARLPWILATGELRPGRNAIGNFPSLDFLWATTEARRDRTASVDRKALRKGLTREVRFTLKAADFEPWSEIVRRFPQWTPEQIDQLERVARSMRGSPDRWRCRPDPLPSKRWDLVETKTYLGEWKPLQKWNVVKVSGDPRALGIIIGGMVCMSIQDVDPATGAQRYAPRALPVAACKFDKI